MTSQTRPTGKRWRVVALAVSALLLTLGLVVGSIGSHIAPPTAHASDPNATEDDFTRSNQSGWGTSTNTDSITNYAWAGDATGSNASISSDQGQFAYPGSTGTVLGGFLGPTASGGDVLARVQFSAVGQAFIAVVLNATTDENNYYQLQLDSSANEAKLFKKVSGTATKEATATFTTSANTSYDLRLDFTQSTGVLEAKVWADSGSEPSTWLLSWTDTGTKLGSNSQGVNTRWVGGAGTGQHIAVLNYGYATSGLAVFADSAPPPTATPTDTATDTATATNTPTATPTPPPTGRYSGDWPHAVDFQASTQWTGSVPSAADAASIDIQWNEVESSRDTFNWTPYDNELTQIHSQGKKAIIILWYLQKSQGNNTNSQAMPQYVFTDIGTSNYFYDTQGGSQIPNYWNSTFISDWQDYISDVATHFGGLTDVGDIVYVRGNTGKGGETTPCLGQGFHNDSQCDTKLQGYSGTNSDAAVEKSWMNWLEFRVTDEANAFTYAYVVAPVDNWDSGDTDPNCPTGYPSAACTYHNEWIYYEAGVLDSDGVTHPFMPGSNALPGNTGNVQGLDEAIAANISTSSKPVHYEFQEVSAAGSSSASVTEAKTAWCYSESDPDVSPGIIDLASVEFYRSVYDNSYAGPGDFHDYEDAVTDPGTDGTVCSGL